MKSIKHCECCGAKIVEYKHILNKGLVSALYELQRHKEPVPLTALAISRNQWTNFQKLRYWGLAEKEVRENGTGTGQWFITSIGSSFIRGDLAVPMNAWTFRGETVRLDGNDVMFRDVFRNDYRRRKNYADDSQVHVGA